MAKKHLKVNIKKLINATSSFFLYCLLRSATLVVLGASGVEQGVLWLG